MFGEKLSKASTVYQKGFYRSGQRGSTQLKNIHRHLLFSRQEEHVPHRNQGRSCYRTNKVREIDAQSGEDLKASLPA